MTWTVTTTGGALAEMVGGSIVDIIDPCSAAHGRPMGIVEFGIVKSVEADGGDITVLLQLTSPTCMMVGMLSAQIREAAMQVPGVESVTVKSDQGLDWEPEFIDTDAVRRRHDRLGILSEPRYRVA
jgi:metal-sulfur cluster biosynthetic enzyme